MASVVFLRAVNVGGQQTFQPSVLAKELADFDVVNVGAAGTLVVHATVSEKRLRAEILRRLRSKPELMICGAREIVELARSEPFGHALVGKGVQQFVSVLERAPRPVPGLPVEEPAGDNWEVRIVGITGRFALSLRRPGRRRAHSNAVVEKHLGIPATTRNWNTICAICAILAE